ncbi:hypothetical protein J5X98_01810 [Leptothermofonsia sichuanensis E412]|uniref:DUF6544 family protein n=1 Tax=Leptothermofonsia sichuanensis TaxID=2917832 RepID=UPI001CA61890|nr:DUF6544 family protein [Leptothermofonsia sichuanensis]QZZ21262.1 hypothetical protein J5X98_01810 [Leptothermofonsia sichuanensis E412]
MVNSRLGNPIYNEALELLRTGQNMASTIITEARLSGLPDPVQRYLRYTQIVGQEVIRTVRLKQKGWFRMGVDQNWQPLVAEQYYTTDPPAFLWYGTIRPFPLLSITGKDQFSNGHGRLQIKALSLIMLADVRGPEVDQGELLRYLGEIAWFPTAWLSDALQWHAIDGQSAQVTMQLQDIAVSATLSFNQQDQLTDVRAERYWKENGQSVLKPWSGQFREYHQVNGLMIPTQAEVTWHLESGDFPYFRGEITEIDYNPLLPY